MRVRPHVHTGPKEEFSGAHLVEENEGTDHLPLRRRESAPDLEAAEIARARHDDRVDRITGETVPGLRVFGGLPAHD